ncbi:MAG: ferrous iron transport protein A [Tissierellia bacterium]|nr:FeoA family protein [Bacillota bacterium]NLL22704.1 ferrous iron transport protein A [Tissierellia bacterium]
MKNLYEVEDKKEYKIEEIPDSDLLATIGVIPGSIIRKEYTYGFGGPAHIKLGTRNVAIGKEMAKTVKVSEVSK